MKEEKKSKQKHSMNAINRSIALKRGTTGELQKKLRRLPSHYNEEQALYQARLLLEEEEDDQEELMFEKKKINIFRFFFHFFEPIDYLYFCLGMIGCIACGISGPLLTYINSNVYSDVGNSSENKGSL